MCPAGFSFLPHPPTQEEKEKKKRKAKVCCDLKLCISLSGLKEAQQLKLHLASIGT
jgi:hypothetical protein